jgi:hypothetical protein
MPLRVTTVDGSPERTILTAMITDAAVLAGISAKWDGKLFSSSWANKVANWAVTHFRSYGQPPGHDISGYFEEWATTANGDKEAVDLISSLLVYISDEYSKTQKHHAPEYVLDLAAKHFTKAKIRSILNEGVIDLDRGDIDKAAKRLIDFRKIEMGGGGYDSFGSPSLVAEMFAQRAAPLITFPKQRALANFYDTSLERDAFIAFFGMSKVGKSYFLLDMVWRAYTQGCKVAYFVVGDMSRLQVWPRLAVRAARRPMLADLHGWDVPIEIENIGKGLPQVKFKRHKAEEDMNQEDCEELFERVYASCGGDRLRVQTWPSRSVSVHGLESVLESWALEDFRPDAIICDYADTLAPIDKKEERRDQINSTWMALRAMSQKWHALVITASQADANAMHAKILTRDNFSDDRRKLDHVTGVVGINRTAQEKEASVYRLNWINSRTLKFSETECLWVASCLPIANPMCVSSF